MSKDFVLILSLALLVVIAWMSVDIYRALTKTAPPVVTAEDLRPVNTEFDGDVLRDLEHRLDKR